MSQEMSRAAQQKIAKLVRKTKEKNEECEKNKWESQKQMKAKEKEKKGQVKEQAEVTELPVKSVATSSSVTIKTKHGSTITVECVANITKGEKQSKKQMMN